MCTLLIVLFSEISKNRRRFLTMTIREGDIGGDLCLEKVSGSEWA